MESNIDSSLRGIEHGINRQDWLNDNTNNKSVFDILNEDNDLSIIVKNISDIINDLDFDNYEDSILCESIITNLEKQIYKNITDGNIVQIPTIGCIGKNKLFEKIRENKELFKLARKNLNKEDYKTYAKDVIIEFKKEIEKLELDKKINRNLINKNKKEYERIYLNIGRASANMFIFSISHFNIVDFNPEWEKHYQSLKD